MKWHGETIDQWRDRILTTWVRRFALFPAQMHDGTWVWLGHYETRGSRGQNGYFNSAAWKRLVGDDTCLGEYPDPPVPPSPTVIRKCSMRADEAELARLRGALERIRRGTSYTSVLPGTWKCVAKACGDIASEALNQNNEMIYKSGEDQ